VLFDEIEKASDALWNLLLGILDKATLTLGDNRRVDFSRAMIFLTSNLGAARMVGNKVVGFQRLVETVIAKDQEQAFMDDRAKRLQRIGLDAARKKFSPEFINRFDKVIAFRPLSEDDMREVLEVELTAVQHRIDHSPTNHPFTINLNLPAKNLILKYGFSLE